MHDNLFRRNFQDIVQFNLGKQLGDIVRQRHGQLRQLCQKLCIFTEMCAVQLKEKHCSLYISVFDLENAFDYMPDKII